MGYRLNWGAHPLPSYRRLPGFFGYATALSFRDVRLKRLPPKSGQPALSHAAAPKARTAPPLTAPGNGCARNWLTGSLPRQRLVAGITCELVSKEQRRRLLWRAKSQDLSPPRLSDFARREKTLQLPRA